MSAGGLRAEHRVDYEDLKGARYNNTELGTWDVGWSGGKEFPQGIEGVYVIDFSEDGKPEVVTGRRRFSLSDYVKAKGIPVPRLGVSVDIRIQNGATGDFRQKIFADNGDAVHHGWRHRYRTHRRTAPDGYRDGYTLLDSRKLDSDRDGLWTAPVLSEINAFDVPAGLDFSVILPATWFDVPVPDNGRPYRTLKFEYLTTDGNTQASIPLREDYFNSDGSLRIGFVYWLSKAERRGCYITGGRTRDKVYVIQSCDKGGVIIERLRSLKVGRCLQIVEGTLRASGKGESILPRFGKKISYYQMATFADYFRNTPEFELYGYSKICNTLTCRMWRDLVYPHNLLWDDPYVRRRVKEDLTRWQYVVDTCGKYGMDFLWETHTEYVPDFIVFYPQFASERYDRKTGEFTMEPCVRTEARNVPRIDAEHPEARRIMEKYWTELFGYFKRLPYVEVVEMAVKGRLQKQRFKISKETYCYGGPFYSAAALDSYREFISDPHARLPVPPGDKETDRTICTTDKKVWNKYREWIIDAYTEGSIMVIERAAYEAFKGNPSYKGLSYMQGAYGIYDQTALLDMAKVIRHPGFYWFVNEHGWVGRGRRKVTRQYVDLAKKHNKKQLMLTNWFKYTYGPGPGELPLYWWGGDIPRHTRLKPAEMLWKTETVFGLFPSLAGWCWHAGFAEESYHFWTAYQTAEWDRGLMPMTEAREIVDKVRDRYEKYKGHFDYDTNHVFRTVGIKKRKNFTAAPVHKIGAEEGIFRGTLKGNEQSQASFQVIADGPDKVRLKIEASDDVYTADPKKYSFPIGKGWAWKDKVDIYLGFAKQPLIRVRGTGGIRPAQDSPRYVHTLGLNGGTRSRKGNTIWVEARCGEENIACYSYKDRKAGKEPEVGRAEWSYSAEKKKWMGEIEINLKAIDDRLSVEKLTGFNLGVQDVDAPCDFMGRPRRGGKAPFYMLYETYPMVAHDTARYANVELDPPHETKSWDFQEKDVFFVDLKPYCNMGFADETADDGKGGWDDTGPDNDLRMLPTGKQKMRGVPFHVIDPAGNRGRSCIVLRGKGRSMFPLSAKGIAVGKKAASLFFLHTTSWSGEKQCGRYVIHYADGSKEDIDLELEYNIGSWWYPGNLAEAEVAWQTTGRTAGSVGLHLMEWKNPHPEKKIGSLDIVSTGRGAVLHLVAVTGVQ